jgi:hypothetical protein
MGGLPEFGAPLGILTIPKVEPASSWLSYLGKPIEKAAKLHITTSCYMTYLNIKP